MRDVVKGDSTTFKFTTRQFSTGTPFTLAGTPVVSVYESGNLIEFTTGVTLTVDYDSRTGLNDVTVATSDAEYENTKIYHLVITTGTVDSVSVVGEVVGEFRVISEAPATSTDVAQDLVDIGLDHLFVNAVAGTDVSDNTVLAFLVSSSATADWDDFVNTTDSMQAIRDRGDAAWVTGTSDATAANQNTIITALTDIQGDTFNTVGDALDDISAAVAALASSELRSAIIIDDTRTWLVRENKAIADKVVVSQPGTDATFACDFREVLNPGTTISSITSVTEENAALIPIDNTAVSQDGLQAHFDLTDLVDDTQYRLKVIVLTTDSQTLVADCLLDCEETP